MGGKLDNEEESSNWEHPFASVSGHKRRSDIEKIDSTEFRVYGVYVIFEAYKLHSINTDCCNDKWLNMGMAVDFNSYSTCRIMRVSLY